MNTNTTCFFSSPFFPHTHKQYQNEYVNEYEYVMDVSEKEKRIHDISQTHPLHFHTYIHSELMPNEIHTLYKYPNIDKFVSLEKYILSFLSSSSRSVIHMFVYSFIHLCDALLILQNQGIIHGSLNDAKNIITTSFDHLPFPYPLICNFEDDIQSSVERAAAPLELRLWNYMKQHRLKSVSEQNVADLISTNAEAVYLRSFINQDTNDIYKAVFKWKHTWDMYMLCERYRILLNTFCHRTEFDSFTKHFELARSMLAANTHVLPEKRKSCLETRSLWIKIFCCLRKK